MYKCLNEKCKRTFPIPAKITIKRVSGFGSEPVLVEKACCPFCEGIDIQPIKETTA